MKSLSILSKPLISLLTALLLLAYLPPVGAQSSLATHTTEADFDRGDNRGGFIVTQHRDGELTLSPQAVNIAPWTALDLTPLPQRLIRHGMVATQGQLFVIGGEGADGTTQSAIYRANIDTAGNLDGWQQIASLPTPLADHTLVVANGHLFVLGGWDGQAATSAVYGTSLEADGQLGEWTLLPPLPTPLVKHTAVAAGDHLFVIGGQDSNTEAQTAVYCSAINADGSLGPWVEMPSLPQPLYSHAAVVADSCLFLTGGYNGSQGVSAVYMTRIDPDDPITDWIELTNTRLPTRYSGHAAVTSNGQIFIIGGVGEGGYDEETIFQATIGADCTLSPWEELRQTPLPNGVMDHAAVAIQGNLIVTGGRNINLTSYDTVYQTKVIPNGSLGTWSELTGSPLPVPLSAHSAAVAEDHLFVTGGESADGTLSATYSARVVNDGGLTAWSETSPLPHPLYEHTAVVADARLLVVGGHDGQAERDSVYAANVNQDGTLGGWQTLNCPLPQPRYGHAAVVADPYLYVIGGRYGFDEQDSVYQITPVSDCGQQLWQPMTPLPQPMWHHAAAVVGDYLFVSGGVSQNGGIVLDSVYRNTIGGEGSLGAWVELTDTPLPEPLHKHTMVAANGYLYLIGGETGAFGERYRIHRTLVSAEGTLEGWEELEAMPLLQALHSHVAVNTDAYLFVLGGTHNYEPQATIYATPLYQGVQQAAYTHQFDLGSDQDIGVLDWRARGDSDAVLSVRFRIAPDTTAEYGPWSEAYTSSPIPIYDRGRYLQYQFLVENPSGGVKAVDEVSLSYGDIGDYIKVVDEDEAGIQGAEVYLNGQHIGATGQRDVLPPEALPQGLQPGDQLVALSPIAQTGTVRETHTTPDSDGVNWAHRTYLTNLEVTDTGQVVPYIVTQPGGQVISLGPDSPLVLYNLLVSIEWDADLDYTQQISRALRSASDYLYDISDGQMAFGYVDIYDDAEHWADADIQISAKNIVRPHAYIGGITSDDKSHVIRVGRFWDGDSGVQGPWEEQDGFRTLVHEFGHYALYLYDEYFAYVFDQDGDLVGEVPATCTGPENRNPATDATNASIMDYQYTASELSARDLPGLWSPLCEQTAQWQLNGESAWETLVRKYADFLDPPRWQFIPPISRGSVLDGPDGPPSAVPDWPLIEIHQEGTSTPTRQLTVYGPQGPYWGALVALYTSQGGFPVAMDQGFTDQLGGIKIYGARSGNTLRATSFDGALGGSVSVTDALTYTLVMAPSTELQALAVPGLNPHLTLRPSSGGDTLYLRLSGLGPGGILAAIVTQSGGSTSQSAALGYSSTEEAYVGMVTFSTFHAQPGTGTVQVIGAGVGSQGISLNTTYALHEVSRDRVTDLYSADGNLDFLVITDTLEADAYAIVSPANAPSAPPEGWQIIGNAYDVRFSGALATLDRPALLKLHYDEALVSSSAISSGLRIYWWDPANQTWQATSGGSVDEEQQVMVAPVTRLGTYALLSPPGEWNEPPPNVLFLPVILKDAP